jgi:hypothetical protein
MIRLMASVPPLLTLGVEVGQHLGPPSAQGAAETGNLGDRAGVEAVQHLHRDLASFRRDGVVDGAQLLVALPGDVDLLARVAGVEAGSDLVLLTLGQVLHAVPE